MIWLRPLPCCVTFATEKGVEPSLDVLCPSCSDYRAYLKYIRYAEPKKESE